MSLGDDYRNLIEIDVRDPDNQLLYLLEYIRKLAAPGHSFEVVVDPNSDGEESFGIDGDGAFYINKIKLNKRIVKFKDGKLLENYLRSL